MGRALIAIIVGIGIMIYNHTSTDSMLVLRGTGIDSFSLSKYNL